MVEERGGERGKRARRVGREAAFVMKLKGGEKETKVCCCSFLFVGRVRRSASARSESNENPEIGRAHV